METLKKKTKKKKTHTYYLSYLYGRMDLQVVFQNESLTQDKRRIEGTYYAHRPLWPSNCLWYEL